MNVLDYIADCISDILKGNEENEEKDCIKLPDPDRYKYISKLPNELSGPGTGLVKCGNLYKIVDEERYNSFISGLKENMTDNEIKMFEIDFIMNHK